MLAERCSAVFGTFITREMSDDDEGVPKHLLENAFEQGTIAAKGGLDIGYCPFSASREASLFLSWIAGFECCKKK